MNPRNPPKQTMCTTTTYVSLCVTTYVSLCVTTYARPKRKSCISPKATGSTTQRRRTRSRIQVPPGLARNDPRTRPQTEHHALPMNWLSVMQISSAMLYTGSRRPLNLRQKQPAPIKGYFEYEVFSGLNVKRKRVNQVPAECFVLRRAAGWRLA